MGSAPLNIDWQVAWTGLDISNLVRTIHVNLVVEIEGHWNEKWWNFSEQKHNVDISKNSAECTEHFKVTGDNFLQIFSRISILFDLGGLQRWHTHIFLQFWQTQTGQVHSQQ